MHTKIIQELLSQEDSEEPIQDDRVLEPLIQALMDPGTSGSRAIFLYALEHLDYILHIEHIIPFIGDTSLEVCAQSFMLLEQLKDKLSEEQKHTCEQVLEEQIRHNESKLLVVALDMVRSWK